MNPGPLRRLIGSIGLLTMGPIAWSLAQGRLTGVEAAQRALVVLVLVVLLGRVVGAYLSSVVAHFDVRGTDSAAKMLTELRARVEASRQAQETAGDA